MRVEDLKEQESVVEAVLFTMGESVVGRYIGGQRGEGLLVAAGFGQQPPQQGAEQGGQCAGRAAAVQQLHHAAPKAQNPGHGKAQFDGSGRSFQGSGRDGIHPSCCKTAYQRRCHHYRPDP